MSPQTPFQAGAAVLTPPRRARRSHGRPPGAPPGGGEGRGGGGGGDGGRSAGGGDAGSFALALALAGIATLFLVLIAVWLFLLRPLDGRDAKGAGPVLDALWASTACLVASSVACERAARAARRGDGPRATLGWLVTSALLGLGFLVAQARLWLTAWSEGLVPAAGGFGTVFFALTGLHALHVSVGLAILALLALRLRRAASHPPSPGTVRLGAVYWHFMGAIWLVLFTLLYVVR